MRNLYYGDNLEILRNRIKSVSIDLCYIDPPFNSKRNYNQIYNNVGKEDKAQAQAFVDTWTWDEYAEQGFNAIERNDDNRFSYQTVQLISGLQKVLGKGSLLAYLVSMSLRIVEIYRVLKSTGSFYLHCDPTASHYLKIILDSVFVKQGGEFRNEIIWHYRKWSIKQGQFVRNHDVILFYSKSDSKERVFNQQFMERAPSTQKRFGNAKIISGHDESGNRVPSKMEAIESEGVPMDDVWDIGRVPPIKQLFPTQKPDELLERIIIASTNEGDVVMDAYCGCGTTVIAAEKLNRQWIGIDITYQSISLILKRLEESYGKTIVKKIVLDGIPKDMASAFALAHKEDDRVRKEFEKWFVLTFSENKAYINEKKGGDKGIDGRAIMTDFDENNNIVQKDVLFSVKSDKTNLPSQIRDFYGTIQREKAAFGYFLTLNKPNANIYSETKQYGKYSNKIFGIEYPVVEIITVQDLLEGKHMAIPTAHQVDVLKKAQSKLKNDQMDLKFD